MSIFSIICLILAALCIGACVVYFFLIYNIPVWAALLLASAHFGVLSTIGADKEDFWILLILLISLGFIVSWWAVVLIDVVEGTIKKKEDD